MNSVDIAPWDMISVLEVFPPVAVHEGPESVAHLFEYELFTTTWPHG